jgi:hypothetical protein
MKNKKFSDDEHLDLLKESIIDLYLAIKIRSDEELKNLNQ